MPARPYKFSLTDVSRVEKGRHRASAVLMDKNFVQYVTASPAQDSEAQAPHSHPYDQLHNQVRGSCLMKVADETYELAPGDVLYIPAGIAHGGVATGDVESEWIEVFGDIRWERVNLAQHQLDWEGEYR